MNNREIFRPRTNLNLAVFGVVICGLFTWSNFYDASTASKIASSLVALFALISIYIFLVRPKIVFGDEGMIIVNPLHEYTIAWSDVLMIDTRWALTVETTEFKVYAWAATASGRKRRSIHHTEVRGLDIDQGGSIRTADSPFTDSGAAAFRLRAKLKKFQEGKIEQSLATSKQSQFQLFSLALIALGAAIAITLLGH